MHPGKLKRIQFSIYMYNRIVSYLEEYVGDNGKILMTCGVRQGSVLGSTMWKVYYDGVLKNPVPCTIKPIRYADDIEIEVAKKTKGPCRKTVDKVLEDITQ